MLANFLIEDIIDTVPENEKKEIKYLKGNVDHAISSLVYDKIRERVAYNTYWGKRDETELQHLSDNYGVGVPIAIPNMRLMAGRINRLIGKALQNNLDYHVTCSNSTAIDIKMQQKRNLIISELETEVNKVAEENKKLLVNRKDAEGKPLPIRDVLSDKFLKKIRQKYGESWQADFEISIEKFLKHITDRKELSQKNSEWFRDLCVTGQEFTRIYVKEEGKLPDIWRVDPENFFYESNHESPWIEDCRRVVYRRYMSPTAILNELGPLMTKEDHKKVARAITSYYNSVYQREVLFQVDQFGENRAITNSPRYVADLIEVFHVEWVATNYEDRPVEALNLVESKTANIKSKKRQRKDRYEGYKIEIAGGIYCGMGKSKHILRTQDDPSDCKLTYNGYVYGRHRARGTFDSAYRTVHDEPFSMVLATKDIQDLYDITHFHLNNLYAMARPGGTITVLEHIPKEFGDTPEERIIKNAAYEKTLSQKVISLSQQGSIPGEAGSIPFNNYGQYSTNLDGQLLQAFISYIGVLESQADKMLGLNPQMMGEVEERSGKGVTTQAIQQAELITKEMFRVHSLFLRKILTSLANLARIAFPNGYYSSIVLGEDHQIFHLDQTSSMADYDVFVTDDHEESIEISKVDDLAMSAISSGATSMRAAFDVILARSVAGKKRAVLRAEEDTQEDARQQVEQLQNEMETINQNLEKMRKENENLKKKATEVEIKKEELTLKKQQQQFEQNKHKEEITLKKESVNNKYEIEKNELKAEILQMTDFNLRNDKINKNR